MDVLNLVSGTIDEIVDCIDCAVNTILVHRELFPRKDFFREEKYNVPVLKTNNVKLKEYIEQSLSRLRSYLSKYPISTLVVVIMDRNTMSVVEGWQFLINVDDPQQPKEPQPNRSMEKQLSNLLKYIHMIAVCLKTPEMRCTFTMLLHVSVSNEDDVDDA